MRWFKKKDHNYLDMLWVMYIADKKKRVKENAG